MQTSKSNRILYTPSSFAKDSLIYLQEVGELETIVPHDTSRKDMDSYLFFIVLEGSGTIEYDNQKIQLNKGNCCFIDCHSQYIQRSSDDNLWKLKWLHFSGNTMNLIYDKFLYRSKSFHFIPENDQKYIDIIDKVYDIASTHDPIRDMLIYEQLVKLLSYLMLEDDSVHKKHGAVKDKVDSIKDYIDIHYKEDISLDELSSRFSINKFYLTRIFKDEYDTSINAYINLNRINESKRLLRFTNDTIESISHNVGIEDHSYFIRLFKRIEGVTPGEYRKVWTRFK